MRTLIERIWCDGCDAEGTGDLPVYNDATHTNEVTLGTSKSRRVDTCDVHYKALIEPLLELLDSHGANARQMGRPPKIAAPKPARRASPAGDGYPAQGPVAVVPVSAGRRFASSSTEVIACPLCEALVTIKSLRMHARSADHGIITDTPDVCPTCGYTPPEGSNPHYARQIIGAHRGAKHDYDPIGELLAALTAKKEQLTAA